MRCSSFCRVLHEVVHENAKLDLVAAHKDGALGSEVHRCAQALRLHELLDGASGERRQINRLVAHRALLGIAAHALENLPGVRDLRLKPLDAGADKAGIGIGLLRKREKAARKVAHRRERLAELMRKD